MITKSRTFLNKSVKNKKKREISWYYFEFKLTIQNVWDVKNALETLPCLHLDFQNCWITCKSVHSALLETTFVEWKDSHQYFSRLMNNFYDKKIGIKLSSLKANMKLCLTRYEQIFFSRSNIRIIG
ncbi:hypothetical protein T4D_9401 [Trichinella pseudospiralis]|uniref:Uncharacterized protein n=1 Tax=Trichinella pseudospiralis TaxID=6337 RepID=A0A0V1G0W1_TRIPS|nr:hypothetical protein T4D_9401 [Trichinella pseudospiralis]